MDLEKTDIALTHFHADHFGLVGSLVRKGTRVYMGEKDAAIVTLFRDQTEERRQGLRRTFLSHGFPEAELQRAIENHPGIRYGGYPFGFTLLKDGDVIEAGSHSLTCIETPGHTPGHMCFYEPKRKILFAGTTSSSTSPPTSPAGPSSKTRFISIFSVSERSTASM